jgi:transcription antitermination factor NusG
MRDNDTLLLENIYTNSVLLEKYFSYQLPDDPKTRLYDFYVITYLDSLMDQPSKNFRDLPTDTVDSVKDAAKTIYIDLKEHLLDAVFWAVCCEFRHADAHHSNRNLINDVGSDAAKFLKYFLKYTTFHNKSAAGKDELTNIFGVRKPSSDKRTPESELANEESRKLSYKGINYALKKTGLLREDFMKIAKNVFDDGSWNGGYGGRAWGNICKGWLLLNGAEDFYYTNIKGRKNVKATIPTAIDHVYQLQHNSDTVFNKLKSYYANGGYHWIKEALDNRANYENKSYFELLKHTSSPIKSMAPPVLYNKLGQTWESVLKKEIHTPSDEKGEKTTEQNTKFKVGDMVKCINATGMHGLLNRGTTYEVEDVVDSKGQEKIKLVGFQTTFSATRFKLLGSGNENSSKEFKVGDKVKCVDNSKTSVLENGKIYEIEDIIIESYKTYITLVGLSGYNFYTSRFELVEEKRKPKFEVGDTVKCIDASGFGEDLNKGQIYTISKVIGIYVKLQGFEKSYLAHRFELAKSVQDEPKKTPKFKVGDMVKCIDNVGLEDKLKLGKIYEVEGVVNDGNSTSIILVGAAGLALFAYRFKLVDSVDDLKMNYTSFKVGDKVKCINDSGVENKIHQNEIYVVTAVNLSTFLTIAPDKPNSKPIQWSLLSDRFELVERAPKEQKPKEQKPKERKNRNTKFKVGDMVKCIDNTNYVDILTVGQKYQIRYVFSGGIISLKEAPRFHFSDDRFEKVE